MDQETLTYFNNQFGELRTIVQSACTALAVQENRIVNIELKCGKRETDVTNLYTLKEKVDQYILANNIQEKSNEKTLNRIDETTSVVKKWINFGDVGKMLIQTIVLLCIFAATIMPILNSLNKKVQAITPTTIEATK